MKRIYISGQITGLPFNEVAAKFSAAEEELAAQGFETVSPLKNGIPYNFPWENHIAMDIVLLIGCDAVYLLEDWHLSRGATLEKNIAELTGKEIIYRKPPVFTELKQAVSEATGVSFYDMTGRDRRQNNVYARMIYARFCNRQGATITDIAAEMRRNHSTIIYYLRKFGDERKFNPKFREMADKTEAALSCTETTFVRW